MTVSPGFEHGLAQSLNLDIAKRPKSAAELRCLLDTDAASSPRHRDGADAGVPDAAATDPFGVAAPEQERT